MKELVKMEVMAIVHGQSEYIICSSIKSNLRLKHGIVARDNGKTSIQVASLMDKLKNDRRFATFKGFIREYSDVSHQKGKLLNFSLFIIMDVDDCTPEQKNRFITKEMFRGHWLYEYIVPIYNDPNLETTMKAAGIEVERKKDYIKLFPTNRGDLDIDIAKEYLEKIKRCKCSNLNEYIAHCISLAEKRT
jgi:hypothetical protein